MERGDMKLVFFVLFLVVISRSQRRQLICPTGVQKFSTASPKQFYLCDQDGIPVLTDCPDGETYQSSKKSCVNVREGEDTKKPQDVKSLGRRGIRLGVMYDARKSEFDGVSSLWSSDTINDNVIQYERMETTTDFATHLTSLEKSDHFDIHASLKMDLLSGMVSVSGGMGYLTDFSTSERQINVEMLYHTTKYTKTLLKKTPIDHLQECTSRFTHVVTSVNYGLDANFVFKYMLSDYESADGITANLDIAIQKIPLPGSVGGGAGINLTTTERNLVEQTTLSMFGDFSPTTSIPASFYDAVDFYQQLPTLSGNASDDYSGTTILDVHLTPLEDICADANNLLVDIADDVLNSVLTMLDELERTMVKVTGLLLLEPVERFPPLKRNLLIYQKALREHQNEAQAVIREFVPKIRAGEGGEDSLAELMYNYTASPFYYPTSDQFLTDRSREITSISFLLETVTDYLEEGSSSSNIKVVDYDNGNDIGLILQRKYVAMLDFRILSPESLIYNFIGGSPDNEEKFWYNNITINGHVGSLLRNFSIFASENNNRDNYGYLVKLEMINEEDEPTTLIAIDDDHSISNQSYQFQVPTEPSPPNVNDISYNSFKFEVQKPNVFITGIHVVIYDALIPSIFTEEVHPIPESMAVDETMEIEMTGREPATMYFFELRYLTKVGIGPASLNNVHFITGPSSEPTSLVSPPEAATTQSVRVSWESPTIIGHNVEEQDLKYSVSIRGEDSYYRNVVTEFEDQSVTFDGLSHATGFDISVLAFLPDQDVNLPENVNHTSLLFVSQSKISTLTVFTTPLPPSMLPLRPEEVGENEVTVRWERPSRLPSAGGTPSYLVEKSLAIGGEVETFTTNETWLSLSGLEKKTLYSFKTKVITAVGESKLSERLEVMTKDEEDELGNFRAEVMRELDGIVRESKEKSSFCASREETNQDGILTYDLVFHEHNTIAGAELDAGSGLFTAGAEGTYQVTANMILSGAVSEGHKVWFSVNDAKVEESLLDWTYDGNMYGVGEDNGGRDIILSLEVGDKVGLVHESSASIALKKVIFCVNSLKLQHSR